MNKEDGKVNNQYRLRNRKRTKRMGEDKENDEEEVPEGEEDDEGEEGRDWQRQHVDEDYNKDSAEDNLDNDELEVPRELNFNDDAGAPAANNQGHGGGGHAGAPQGPAAVAHNQGRGGEGCTGAPQGPAGVANNQGRGGGNHAGAPQGPAGAANNQGRGGGNRAGAPQGPAGAANNQGHGGENCAEAPQVPAGVAGAAVAVPPINCMETPFRLLVEDCLQAYKSPFNDPTREDAMRSARAHPITLQHLVDNPSEERQTGEYMVCTILAIVIAGTAQTRGRTNGKYSGPQQNMPYQ
jgi:hypothetical protein